MLAGALRLNASQLIASQLASCQEADHAEVCTNNKLDMSTVGPLNTVPLFNRNIIYVTPKIIYLFYLDILVSGSKYPTNI